MEDQVNALSNNVFSKIEGDRFNVKSPWILCEKPTRIKKLLSHGKISLIDQIKCRVEHTSEKTLQVKGHFCCFVFVYYEVGLLDWCSY